MRPRRWAFTSLSYPILYSLPCPSKKPSFFEASHTLIGSIEQRIYKLTLGYVQPKRIDSTIYPAH